MDDSPIIDRYGNPITRPSGQQPEPSSGSPPNPPPNEIVLYNPKSEAASPVEAIRDLQKNFPDYSRENEDSLSEDEEPYTDLDKEESDNLRKILNCLGLILKNYKNQKKQKNQ